MNGDGGAELELVGAVLEWIVFIILLSLVQVGYNIVQ